ncbi:MAG TPA: NADH:flavin oxidoreductase [Hypericibacter adhaerens]|jgi:2,4-dienoyl-CoA reductase-like NADH-dependent reductase (Old Yellow Enzyme family)/thioredoxin reductase|uniref:N-methylproline demethylase n=1 Tax=Hypericibacter adhaerens TaxID=2602016 RepID=A0A5J6N0V3_9PROT|nr:NADH:flavin oxidoreductase [Hypericibacter adhaerens]QEX23638.1 N-methylproline demethylase [Hypericibacter adhaerens]HWA41627.1 NADH:flavin oxidoreductase [Hypericibacter adhaerens]
MSSKDPLLQPFTLKHLVLKNRLMSTAHEPAYSEDGLPKERYRLYHLEKAKGGIALTMTAGSAVVSEDSPAAFGNLHAYKDEIVPLMKRLAEDCHGEGCAVMIQLTHLGRRTGWNKADWLPVAAPSVVREPAHRAFPKEAEDWDIERWIGQYADGAERMQAAGLDGIEIECYGHLVDQFWTPAVNKRHDNYGGSLENRMRFGLAVVKAIRERVGPDFLLGARMVLDEARPGGLGRTEGLAIARRMIAEGVDFINVIRGFIDTDAALAKVIPVMGMKAAPHLDFVGEMKRELGVPILHAARIADVATARHAVASGKLDLVGMTRALIADPHLARKVAEGREIEIRPCVGATYCLDRIYEGGEALCIHNPATGRESTMPQIVQRTTGKKRRIVVVGAGPAGLEAARVSAERGHEVILFEAADEAGGQIRLAARAKRRRELLGIVDWRMQQLEKLGVALRFNKWAEAEDVTAEAPDIVVIATGGLPQAPALETGTELTVSTWDILSGDAKPAKDVLLFDDNGAHPGMQAAEAIAETGSKLEVVSPERFFAPEIGGLNHVPYAEIFQQHGVRITILRRLLAVKRAGNRLQAVIGSDFGDYVETREVDQVVVEHGTLPNADLYEALRPDSVNRGEVSYKALIAGQPQTLVRNPAGRYRLIRIGDAVSSRNIHAAIYDALRFAKDF